MAYVAKFYHNSTGYVEGSAPPRFDKKNVKPIPMCGSDSLFVPDGRWSRDHVEREAIEHAKKLNKNLGLGIVGYQIMRRGWVDYIPAGLYQSL